MRNLRNDLTAIRMNFVCKAFVFFDTFFIPKTKCISKIRNIRINTCSVYDETYVIGDAKEVAQALEAVRGAYELGYRL